MCVLSSRLLPAGMATKSTFLQPFIVRRLCSSCVGFILEAHERGGWVAGRWQAVEIYWKSNLTFTYFRARTQTQHFLHSCSLNV